jgi:predicted nucleic acid-binding protein
MTLILDASVLTKLLLNEPDSPKAMALARSDDIIAPDFARLEVGNALWSRVHMGKLAPAAAKEMLALLDAPDIEYVSVNALAARALSIATAIDHPIYDCAYLALAEHRRIPLVTADGRFLSAVRRHGLSEPRLLALSEMP